MRIHTSRAWTLGLALAALLTGLADIGQAQPTVRLQDKTSSTGLSLESGPLASTGFEGSGDGLTDLQVHYSSNAADFYGSDTMINGIPQWDDDTAAFYGSTHPASGSLSPLSLDFNNDGYIDLLVRYYPKLYEGDGSSFTDVTTASGLPTTSEIALTAGDFNQDGWTDVVSYDSVNFKFWKNLGNDSNGDHQGFSNTQTLSPTGYAYNVTAMICIDIDSDGDLDVFVGDNSGGTTGGGNGPQNLLFTNNAPNSTLFSQGSLPSAFDSRLRTEFVAVADVLEDATGDPYPELIIGGYYAELYENDSGTLSYSTGPSGSPTG